MQEETYTIPQMVEDVREGKLPRRHSITSKAMQALHQTIQVTYSYGVHFTNQLFARENLLLREVISGIDGMEAPMKA